MTPQLRASRDWLLATGLAPAALVALGWLPTRRLGGEAALSAAVKGHGRHDKVRIVKFRRRKHHRKQAGHRQHYTENEITGISG